MQIIACTQWDDLLPYAESWDRIAGGVPFRSYAWVSTWWKHYGPTSPDDRNKRLMVLIALDAAGRLTGVAPWFLERSAAKGWVLQWLGSGREVCSDYVGIHCMPDDADRVTEAMARYLTGPQCAPGGKHCWDLFEVEGVDGEDAVVGRLLKHLSERGCTQHANKPMQSWRLELPSSWEEFLKLLAKGLRGRLRRFDRRLFETGRAVFRTVETCEEFETVFEKFIELHQKRRQSLGEPGCFAWPRFAAFHREVARLLLLAGQLRLVRIELDGRTIGIEYQMFSQGVTYVYQVGIDPERLDDEPGHLLNAATIKHAIEQGGRAVDFLRGDEPYKGHYRTIARPQMALRVVPNRTFSKLRNQLWLTGRSVKRWVKERT